MLSNKKYLKILFIILGTIVSTTVGYSVYFSKHYPIPLIDHISFDAKMQFIREHIDINKIDTIVVGSSLALNNVQGAYLEKNSNKCQHVLNLSVWSVDAPQVEQLLKLTEGFSNLKRIIYTGQFTSFNFANEFKNFDGDFIKRYISHELNPIEYSIFILNACKDISFCAQRQRTWAQEHGRNNTFGYLGFDHTGSVALNIHGKDIVQKRWTKTDGATQNPYALKTLSRIAKMAYDRKVRFYFIQQPYRQAQIDKFEHIQKIMKTFPKQTIKILNEYDGIFFNLHEKLHLNDDFFADRSHLNDKGSKVVAEEIGKFIDKIEVK